MATYSSIKYNFTPPSATTSTQVGAGAMTLIKSIDSDGSDATITFVDGSGGVVFDNTYKTYIFKLIGIHPETDEQSLGVNFSIDTGSNYNATKSTTFWRAFHKEDDSSTTFGYVTYNDLAASTADQIVQWATGNGNDECSSGELWLFGASSTTFQKHFFSVSSDHHPDGPGHRFVSGSIDSTSAVDAIRFAFASGEIQAGTIKMYGIA